MPRTCLLLISIVLCTDAVAAQPRQRAARAPKPSVADFIYGTESERQKLDFWRADSKEPAPLVLMIHGGGWRNGDKTKFRGEVQQYLDAGISVAAINYRLIQPGDQQGTKPPVKAPLYDAARALQTIRAMAKDWNVDPEMVAATGGSAGACTSLWLAFHDDLADPESEDPIARQSTRLECAAVYGAQTSLDPVLVREWIPNARYGGHAFGFPGDGKRNKDSLDNLLANREKVLPWIKEYSPMEHVSADDPPVYLDYPNQKVPPKLGQVEKDPTHSAMYGVKLADKLDEVGVEYVLAYPQKPDDRYGSRAAFIIDKLSAGG